MYGTIYKNLHVCNWHLTHCISFLAAFFTSVCFIFFRGGSIPASVDIGFDFTGVDVDDTPSVNCELEFEYMSGYTIPNLLD